ncbi:hypothetical protein L1987_54399 [Smallanthus sonchifolius]|uniref:Uncharacterized protein n=1 Tax=Smallanthus sonchifolius TaxID=185202 RepID=A0ACB9E740_9ASTR|nr:hypothetical protein L1987_54399 [Smallanthus sonchifolius]
MVRVESDQHSKGQPQSPLETENSKPLPVSVEPNYTSVAIESSSVATVPLNQNTGKGKMSVIVEEDIKEDVSENIATNLHSIIPGTNMPLGLADEIAQRLQEEEIEVARGEEAERNLEVYQSKVAITIQQNISLNASAAQAPSPLQILKIKKEFREEAKDTTPQETPSRIKSSSLLPQQTPSPRREYSTPSPQR